LRLICSTFCMYTYISKVVQVNLQWKVSLLVFGSTNRSIKIKKFYTWKRFQHCLTAGMNGWMNEWTNKRTMKEGRNEWMNEWILEKKKLHLIWRIDQGWMWEDVFFWQYSINNLLGTLESFGTESMLAGQAGSAWNLISGSMLQVLFKTTLLDKKY